MAIIRAKQGVITRILPHQGNRRYLIPGGKRGYPLSSKAKSLDYNFAADKSLVAAVGPTLTCTRASEATYFDASGVMQTASNNVARFDHNPSTLASLGLLIEEARTTLVLWSEDISNAAWVASNITKGSTSVTAPDGAASTTVRLTASAGNGTLLQSITSASANRVFAVYMKRVTGTGNIDLTCDGGSTWTTKTLTADWTRFDITQSAVTNPQVGVRIVTSGDAIDFWGADIQTGSFATSYIPNDSATASVTRAADAMNPSNDLTWFNHAGPGTVYYHAHTESLGQGEKTPIYIKGTGTSFYARLNNGSGAQVAICITDQGSSNTCVLSGAAPAASEFRGVFALDTDDAIQYLDGSANGTDTVCDVPGTMDGFYVGRQVTVSNLFNGHIARIVYYDERLTDTQLEDLSNGTFP